GTDPQLDTFASETETLNALAEVTTAEIAAAETGKIAVVADESLIEAIAEVLADFDFGRSVRGLDHQIALINPDQAKGLEFDSVIIVEPGRIAPGGSEAGIGGLYVALTRTTERLRILASAHTEPRELLDAPAERRAGRARPRSWSARRRACPLPCRCPSPSSADVCRCPPPDACECAPMRRAATHVRRMRVPCGELGPGKVEGRLGPASPPNRKRPRAV